MKGTNKKIMKAKSPEKIRESMKQQQERQTNDKKIMGPEKKREEDEPL